MNIVNKETIYIVASYIVVSLLIGACANGPEKLLPTETGMPESLQDRARLIKLLSTSQILSKDRSLVHLSHVCNLIINKLEYPVLNVRELVKGAMTPSGINRIIVLNSGYQMVRNVEYTSAYPLFCEGRKLYLHGNLIVDGFTEKGNVLQFDNGGYEMLLLNEDLNNKLPL